MAELVKVRTKGFAIEDEEAFVDGCCVGCPIFAGGEMAVAALSSRCLSSDYRKERDWTISLPTDEALRTNIISDNLKVRLGSN